MTDDIELKRLINHYKDCKEKLDKASKMLINYLTGVKDTSNNIDNPNSLSRYGPCNQVVINNGCGLPVSCSVCNGNIFSWDGKSILKCECGASKIVKDDEYLYVIWKGD